MNPTILVLEDDAALRDLLCEVLRDEGFTVVAADALQPLLRVAPKKANLLITDLFVNNEIIGVQAVERIRSTIRPDLPALICTGAQKQVEGLQPEIQRLNAHVLAKPFTLDELFAAVQQAIKPIDRAPQPMFSAAPAVC